jgi:hypothetical protein
MQPCGDWCPKFEEMIVRGNSVNSKHSVTICGGPTYEIISDERPKGAAHAQE